MKNVNQNIMSIAIAKNVLLENIMELADREVDGTQTCEFSVSILAQSLTRAYEQRTTLFCEYE